MILKPDIRTPVLKAWGVFAATLVVTGGLLAWLLNPGDLPERMATAERAGKSVSGPVDLAQHIAEARAANAHLATTIETLKKGVGFTVVPPYLVPAGERQPGQYFNDQLLAVQDRLRALAQERSVTYQRGLGFDIKAAVPKNEDAPYLLTMLQLTEKLGTIILKTPTPILKFAIKQPEKAAVVTGPANRPPLLKEYPLTLEVRAGLTDILWILHRLAHTEDLGGYPLTVRSFTLTSANADPKDEIQQLDAVIEVAGLQFLSDTERTTTPARPPTRGLGGR